MFRAPILGHPPKALRALLGMSSFESVTVTETLSTAAWDTYLQPTALAFTACRFVVFEGTHFEIEIVECLVRVC